MGQYPGKEIDISILPSFHFDRAFLFQHGFPKMFHINLGHYTSIMSKVKHAHTNFATVGASTLTHFESHTLAALSQR